jgi:hypothetical protein
MMSEVGAISKGDDRLNKVVEVMKMRDGGGLVVMVVGERGRRAAVTDLS